MIFQISRCQNDKLKEGQPKCKDKKEINNFIRHINVNTWTMSVKPNFTDHDSKRSLNNKELFQSTKIVFIPGLIVQDFYNIRHNNV